MSGWYKDDVAHKLSRMTQKVVVQLRDRAFGGTDPVSIIIFLQDVKGARDPCNIHSGDALWLFKHFSSSLDEAVIKIRVKISTQTANDQEGCLTSYSAVVNFSLERYATDETSLYWIAAYVNFGKAPYMRRNTPSTCRQRPSTWLRVCLKNL